MNKRSAGKMLIGLWLVLALLLAMAAGAAAEGQTELSTKRLKNGSFEEGQSWSGDYKIQPQGDIPSWFTTAFDKKIELFRSNSNTYVGGITLTPPDGSYAAELNANEESTLYQVLPTEPSSIYEWSLYHGSRSTEDTMALIVGPEQANPPAKPSQNGRDQFMQTVDWLKDSGNYHPDNYLDGHLYNNGTPIVIYSKKFGPDGTFENNEADNAFSMTPSAIHTEEWHIWLMRDAFAQGSETVNPWTRYGAKSDVQSGANQQGSANGAQSEYYRYRVPAGQTSTIFAFVSVSTGNLKNGNKASISFGNFLDCVNFEIYHHVTASRTAHGTATVAAEKADEKGTVLFHTNIDVSEGSKVSADVPDGAKLTLTATTDSEDSVFAGVYYRRNGVDPEFIPSSDDSKWTATDNTDGTKTYVCNSIVVNNACDLHFVFVKSPTITYDANGGDAYDCGQVIPGDPGKAANVYSFKPDTATGGAPTLVGPYTSHKPTKTTGGQEDENWLFAGWMLMDDVGNAMMLKNPDGEHDDADGVHRVACNYSFQTGSAGGTIPKQPFLVIGKNEQGAVPDFDYPDPQMVTVDGNSYTLNYWKMPNGAVAHYNGSASGLTFIAQWKWKQKYTPMRKTTNNNKVVYVADVNAGNITVGVEVLENGNKTVKQAGENDGDEVSKRYFAGAQETMYVTATANPGYEFEGWYDGDTLVTTKNLLRYTVGREDVLTYEAHFVGTVTQNYIRQIKDSGGTWVDVPQDHADVPALTPEYSYQVGPGTTVSCTAAEDTDQFAFIGWYEIKDNKYVPVGSSFLANNGRTLSYNVTGNATYYARFVPKVYFKVRFVDSNNDATRPSPAWGEGCGTVSTEEATAIPGEAQISSTASANPGYDFIGWYTSDGEGWQSTECGASSKFETAMPAESRTYYAMFAARDDSHYSVEHIKVKPDGSTETVESETRIYNGVATGTRVQAAPLTTIPGYTYRTSVQGVDENGNMTTYTSNPEGYVLGSGLVLRLYYAPDDVPYKIEYYWLDANGNETLRDTDDTKKAKTDETVKLDEESSELINRYESDGYVYAAGYGRNKLEGVVTADPDPVLVLKVYYRLKPCTVKFDMDEHGILGEHSGHVIQVPDQTVAYGGLATRPEDPLDYTDGAYEFERWEWENDAGKRETYSFDNPVTRDTLFLYAVWSKVHEVRYHMQGHGDQVPTEKVKDGGTAARPADPTAEGCSFRGWYTEETYEHLFGDAEFAAQVKSDIDLYAKWTANVTVTKVWQDSADHSNDSVRVRLLKGGIPYADMPDAEQLSAEGMSVPQNCEQVLNGTNSWTHTWTNLPADDEYTVAEDIPQDYTAVYSEVSANGWKITNVQDRHLEATIKNTHTSDTIDMVVHKEWQDANNRNRPGSVRVQIRNGGTGDVVREGELNSGNGWTWSVTDLPKRENGGQTVSYIVEEVGVNPGYGVSCDIVVREDGSCTVTLTNVLTGKLDISCEKLWTDDGNRDGLRPDHVQLKIYQNAIADANLVRIVVVKPQSGEENTNRWTWTIEDLPLYDSFGARNVYFVVEDPVPNGYADPGPMRVPEQDWGS